MIPRGLDRLWGFRRRIDVPLASIVEVRTESHPRRVKRGLRFRQLYLSVRDAEASVRALSAAMRASPAADVFGSPGRE
ncbi:hypothetical protein D9V32_15475 [Mycetocola tolaasinivorans]|uniref:Uncharacterized protein n=1 Tax=Mycetocola tolaasinivorans TaxID=76635 RepID=A0A3L6ZWA8_9MICO|nr:hypothetical protein [Mycetocola tolaasinivorans]RLP72296.1 hypothetical protein D9V32_15475 [Mycetocola tolaasinivorans]